MSSRINLNDNVEATFGFTVGGLDYDFRYPTMEELTPIQEINEKKARLEAGRVDSGDESVEDLDKKLEQAFYSFIVPVGHKENIKDVLKKQPYPVVKAFNKMIADQLAAE